MKDVLYFCIKGWWDWIRLVLIWMWCAWKHDVTIAQALCEQPDKTFLKLKPGTLPCWFTFYVIVRTNDVCVYNIYILESSSQLFMFFSLFHYVKILVIFYSIWWVHLALIYMEGQASGCQFGKTDEWHCMTTCFYSNWSVETCRLSSLCAVQSACVFSWLYSGGIKYTVLSNKPVCMYVAGLSVYYWKQVLCPPDCFLTLLSWQSVL